MAIIGYISELRKQLDRFLEGINDEDVEWDAQCNCKRVEPPPEDFWQYVNDGPATLIVKIRGGVVKEPHHG